MTHKSLVFFVLCSWTLCACEKNNEKKNFLSTLTHEQFLDSLKIKLDTQKIDLFDQSTQGAYACVFFDNEQIKIIEAYWFGESGKKMTQFYWNNDNKLQFAIEQTTFYKIPISQDYSPADSIGDILTMTFEFENEKISSIISNKDTITVDKEHMGQEIINLASQLRDRFHNLH